MVVVILFAVAATLYTYDKFFVRDAYQALPSPISEKTSDEIYGGQRREFQLDSLRHLVGSDGAPTKTEVVKQDELVMRVVQKEPGVSVLILENDLRDTDNMECLKATLSSLVDSHQIEKYEAKYVSDFAVIASEFGQDSANPEIDEANVRVGATAATAIQKANSKRLVELRRLADPQRNDIAEHPVPTRRQVIEHDPVVTLVLEKNPGLSYMLEGSDIRVSENAKMLAFMLNQLVDLHKIQAYEADYVIDLAIIISGLKDQH